MAIDWEAFGAIIHAHQRFVLTSHIRPDCDALGSELGMAHVLEALGKDVRIVNGQAAPPNIAFIDPTRRIRVLGADLQAADLQDREVLMVLDTSAWEQLGSMAEVVRRTSAKKMVLDHHVSEDDLGAENFKDRTAEATGRLVVEAADHLQVSLTKDMATPLFAALATDTGWFRFGSVSAETYRIAGRLVEAGAQPHAIYAELYEQDTLGRVLLRGVVLSRLQLELNGRLVHTYVRCDDYTATQSLPTDTEDAINLAFTVAGTEVAVILVEKPSGGFKISLRSRGAMDCSQVASHFGGGGHRAAAGASIDAPFAIAQEQVLQRVRTAMV